MERYIDALLALNERKTAAFGQRAGDAGEIVPMEAWRPILIGLDLDVTELEALGNLAIANGLTQVADADDAGRQLMAGASQEQVMVLGHIIKSLAIDCFTAGVLFDRERR
jgi:hypothetical protein